MTKPDTITVRVFHQGVLEANQAEIHATVKGSSLVTGNDALEKAKEVQQFTDTLKKNGIDADRITLRCIHAESTSGILGKSSSANYHLSIDCQDLDTIAEILNGITADKNTQLDWISWKYPDEDEVRLGWIEQTISRAEKQANRICRGLGVELIGVYRFRDRWCDREASKDLAQLRRLSQSLPSGKANRDRTIDLGFPATHTKQIQLQVDIDYRISAPKPRTPARKRTSSTRK